MKRFQRAPATAFCVLAAALATTAAAAPLGTTADDPSTAPASAAVAAPALQGVVFLSDAGQAKSEGWPALSGAAFDMSRVPAMDKPDLAARLQPLLGRPISDVAAEVTAVASDYFKSIGRPFVSVMPPRQALTNGVLQLVVVEARLGTLKVEGSRWFDKRQYLGAMPLASGETIDVRVLNAGLDQINRNPFRRAQLVASPGAVVGATDLTIRAQERFPLAFTLGADNTGNAPTGRTRLSAGVEWGNALWRGDDATYTYVTSTDRRRLRQHAGSYTFLLPSGDTLSLSGSRAISRGDTDGVFSSTGRNSAASVRYTLPLGDRPNLKQSLVLGFDYKQANNDLLFGGASVFPTSTDTDQFVVVYTASWADGHGGGTDLNASLVGSPGGITSGNNDATFTTQRSGATARYAYLRAQFNRMTPLPYRLSWFMRATGQVSTSKLLPSEMLAFGGSQSLRGFNEQTAIRDNGLLLTNELRSPAWSSGLSAGKDRLSVFAFIDMGLGRNHDDHGPNATLSMISAGPGVSYQFGNHVSLRLAQGFVLHQHGVPGGKANRPLAGLQVSF